MVQVPKTICFDLDGCLCTQTEGDYEHARPIPEAIRAVNRFFDEGYRIVLHTARFMGRHGGDVARAHAQGYEFTQRQLADWGVKYHTLLMGKPPAHVVVDDRSVFFVHDWARIEQQIRERLAKRNDAHA